MTTPADDPSSPAADEAVMAEWQRIEEARIAEDRDEARDDAESAPHPLRTWAWVVLGLALLAGIVATVLLNVRLGPAASEAPPSEPQP